MKKFQLIDAFLVGHKQIDDEHRALVAVFNQIVEAYQARDISACQEKWCEFIAMLERHFEAEEEIMASYNYVEKSHNALHGNVMKELAELDQIGDTLACWQTRIHRILDNLIIRILKHDINFANYLESHGHGKNV